MRVARIAGCALAGVAATLAGCGGDPAPARVGYAQDGSLPAGVRAKDRFDVVIVAIPALRYDDVFGAGTPAMPRLAKFAEDAAVFDEAAATSGWELPSYASLLTGLTPCAVGATAKIGDGVRDLDLIPSIVTLPEVLAAQGWSTYEMVRTPEFVEGVLSLPLTQGFQTGLPLGFDGPDSIPAFPVWADRARDEAPQLIVCPLHPDAPTPGPRGRADRLERLRRLDGEFERLLAVLEKRGVPGLVCVVGTCGESVSADGNVARGGSVRDDVLHVPLVMRAPGRVKPGRVHGSCSVMDVTPTILELAGLPSLSGVSGRSLLPLVASPHGTGRPVEARDAAGATEFFAIRTADVKVVVRRDTVAQTWTEEAYDLRADPREEHPLSGERRPALGVEVERLLEALRVRLRGVRHLAEDAGMDGYDTRGLSGC